VDVELDAFNDERRTQTVFENKKIRAYMLLKTQEELHGVYSLPVITIMDR
jgi:hypothetical protein